MMFDQVHDQKISIGGVRGGKYLIFTYVIFIITYRIKMTCSTNLKFNNNNDACIILLPNRNRNIQMSNVKP